MASDKKNNLAIWKINSEDTSLTGLSSDNAILEIISRYNSKENLSEAEKLEKIPLNKDVLENKKIVLFHKKRWSSGWSEFLGHLVDLTDQKIKDRRIFSNENNDLLCFIYDETDIFLITSGAGYHAIQDFVDENFPLAVAIKLFTGEFNHSEIRGLTGISHSKSENYRRSYVFSRQEAFGKIWKKLSGRIDPEVIKNTPALELVLDPEKKRSAEMKSSFTFRKSVIFEEVIQLINGLQSLPEADEEKMKKFAFLKTLREVKSKEEKIVIKTAFLRKIFEILKSDDFEDAKDLDFCHPKEAFAFFSGSDYSIDGEEIPIDDYPRAEDVLRFVEEQELIKLDTIDNFIKSFESLKFSFKSNGGDELEVPPTSLIRCFHGELEIGDKTYFIVDGKYYQPIGTFLDVLLEDFCTKVFGTDGLITSDVPFEEWKKNAEGKHIEAAYNRQQSQRPNFLFGDAIFVGTQKGKIELFDLLYETEEKLYIIQVKGGFGASIRDACSQIEIAAEIIEQDLSDECKILKKYFQDWSRDSGNTKSEEEFLSLFKKTRIYILACSKSAFTKENFESKRLKSNIAQYELLGISNLFQGKGYSFKIQNIARD